MAPNLKFKDPNNKIAAIFSWEANLKISRKNIEKCRMSGNISDWDWSKSANGDTAALILWHFWGFSAIESIVSDIFKGLGPQNPTKKLAHVGVLLGHLLSQNPEPPPPIIGEKTASVYNYQ